MKQVPEPPNDEGGKTKPPNTNGEILDMTPDEFFGIPLNAYIPREILKRIKDLIGKSDFNIQSVCQKQYQEIYLFQKGDEVFRVDINYNKNRKITKIASSEQTELSLEIIDLVSPLEGLVIPPPASKEDPPDEFFGIPPNAHDSREILKQIKELIENSDIKIRRVRKTGYQETYLFEKGNELSKVDIYCDSKGRVTSIVSPEQTELSLEIIELISPLEGFIIPETPIDVIEFEEKFLNTFHKRLRSLVEQQGITITNVELLNWALRYTVIRSGKNAVFDVYFTSKKRFTTYDTVKSLCNSTPLLDDIETIITESLNQ